MMQMSRSNPLNILRLIGNHSIDLLRRLGAAAIFFCKAFIRIFRPKQAIRIIEQVYHIGAASSSIVVLVALFTGMVFGLQLHYTLIKFGAESGIGAAVSLSLIRELGPVLTAIMITARAGSAMTAELGIQRISEQIDALFTMRIDPVKYLVSPRIAASLISFPILTAFFDLVGILGGWFTAVLLLGGDQGAYFYRAQSVVLMADVKGGFIKSIVFALIVSGICCYQGYFTHLRKDTHGSRSVSKSTTSAVVLSCIMILVSDYVVTSFLM